MDPFNDDDLQIVSDEMDLCLTGACVKHKMPPVMLSAIVLARLMHLNNSVETSEDFAKLLQSVAEKILNNELTPKKENLH